MITEKEVKHIAELAHLELTEKEVGLFTKQLGDVLESFEKLDQLDTQDVVPTAYTVSMTNIMREDQVEKSMEREKILQNAPDKKDGFFRVPPITGDE